jgi:GNAT superfamily N-acetyltransferase
VDHIPIVEANHPSSLELWLRLQQLAPTPEAVIRSWNAVHLGQEAYLLAVDGVTLAGGIMLTLQPPVAQLRAVFVAEAHRHKGIGAALIQAAVARAQARGCTHIFTVCEARECVGLYKRQGFVKLDSIVVYRKPEHHEQRLVQPVSPV